MKYATWTPAGKPFPGTISHVNVDGHPVEIDPVLQFEYVPATSLDANRHADTAKKNETNEEAVKRQESLVLRHLKSWSLPVEINAESLQGLGALVFMKLYLIILRHEVSDDPMHKSPDATVGNC